ncbi:HDOD domain-containing protein [Clostridiaceae bacterium HSG29]|nr:HDOD domain-containing protein [Clostridiaceae bacterium HSG29]
MKTLIARQPILNERNQTIAYELLFRGFSDENEAIFEDGNVATNAVLKDLLIDFGVTKLANGKKLFINFTEDLLLDKSPLLLRKDEVVVEILEDIYDSDELIEVIKKLKKSGYVFAMDDFIYNERKIRLLDYADIIKVDFIEFSKEEIIKTAEEMKKRNKKMLAEKVETYEEFEFAKKLGFTMFQGYYFMKPEMLETVSITTIPSTYTRLLAEFNKEEVNFDVLAEIAKDDVSLVYSILSIVNSVAYYSRRKITSLKDGLTRLGLKEGKKIIYFNFLKAMSPVGTPNELLKKSLIRARQAEKLAKEYGMNNKKEKLFLLGMFSLINIILRRDMSDILENLPLDEEITDALVGERNELSDVLALIIINERGKMDKLENYLNEKDISIDKFSEIYFESIQWADTIMD